MSKTVNYFEYKAENLTPDQKEKEAIDLLLDIEKLVTEKGTKAGRYAYYNDPDKTFSIYYGPHFTRVSVIEGEDSGEPIYFVAKNPIKCRLYIPGPWTYRVRILLDN